MMQGKNFSQERNQYTNLFGYFDKYLGEYVITRASILTPWINHLGMRMYDGILSNNKEKI